MTKFDKQIVHLVRQFNSSRSDNLQLSIPYSLMPFSIGRFLFNFSYILVKIPKSHFIGQISQMALNQKAVFEVKYP